MFLGLCLCWVFPFSPHPFVIIAFCPSSGFFWQQTFKIRDHCQRSSWSERSLRNATATIAILPYFLPGASRVRTQSSACVVVKLLYENGSLLWLLATSWKLWTRLIGHLNGFCLTSDSVSLSPSFGDVSLFKVKAWREVDAERWEEDWGTVLTPNSWHAVCSLAFVYYWARSGSHPKIGINEFYLSLQLLLVISIL